VPNMVAGHCGADDCTISIPNLLNKTAIKITYAACIGIDTTTKTVHLNNGMTQNYDVLSIDATPQMDKDVIEAQIPGAKEHAVFVQPLEQFVKLWPQIEAHAEQKKLRIGVIGASAIGIEMAMALKHRLPSCAVTLVSGPLALTASYSANVQKRLLQVLKQRNITLLQDIVVRIEAAQLNLASGASLACDIPILTVGDQAPTWLKYIGSGSQLALDEQGNIAVNAYLQSISHGNVFATGDKVARSDTAINAPLAKNEAIAKRVGPTLYANLLGSLMNQPLKENPHFLQTLNLINCGDRNAIASWGNMAIQGKWAWHWKNVIDQRWLRLYQL
jgi:NADH dehydrogenase FAD-containing subunit